MKKSSTALKRSSVCCVRPKPMQQSTRFAVSIMFPKRHSIAGNANTAIWTWPMQKKQAVAHVVGHGLCSVRRACHYLGVHRSTYRYRAKSLAPKKVQLHQRIVALSWQHPRYGYRRIRALLAQEGWSVSRKQVQRVRRKEGLKVRPKPQRIPAQRDLDRLADPGV